MKMSDKIRTIIQEKELQTVRNKLAVLINDNASINVYELENLYNRLNRLAADENLSEDFEFSDLSNCYVEFLKCISIYLANFQYHVDDFTQLNKWIRIIYDKPSGAQLSKIFTEDIAIPISEAVCNDFLQLGIERSISLLYFINSVAERDMLNRLLITFKLLRLKAIYNAICLCGDYVLQSNLLNFMIHLCSSEEKYHYAVALFKENKYIEKAFIRTCVYDFEDPARKFLTIVNQTFKKVCSIRAKYLKIDENIPVYAVYDDEDYYSVSLDINKTSQTISISCNITHFPEYLVSKGNGKVGNQFIIINFSQIAQVSYSRFTYSGLEYICFYIYVRILTYGNILNQKICLKSTNMKEIVKIEEEVYPFLKNEISSRMLIMD